MIKQAIEYNGKIFKEDDMVEVEYHMLSEAEGLDIKQKNIRGRLCDIRSNGFSIDYSEQYHAGSRRIFMEQVDCIGPMKGSETVEKSISGNRGAVKELGDHSE